jgi:hypothetical protein
MSAPSCVVSLLQLGSTSALSDLPSTPHRFQMCRMQLQVLYMPGLAEQSMVQ